MTTLIKKLTHDQVVCGRFGGEEFLILIPDMQPAAVEQLAGQICPAESALYIRSGSSSITASLSVVQAGLDDADLSAVIARASQALYRAKDSGRNRVSI